MELAGADVDILEHEEPEETEVVRKMVHHFEASSKSRPSAEVPVTINNQTPLAVEGQRTDASAKPVPVPVPVTVNNHINVADGILTHSTNDASTKHENGCKEDGDGHEEPKTFQSEAKDIHLDNSRDGTLCTKVCRNKNVDLAFTLVKQQPQQPVKSSGIKEQDMARQEKYSNSATKMKASNGSNPLSNYANRHEIKGVTYENTLVPTITATSEAIREPGPKLSMGDLKADEEPGSQMPEQIIVPIEIHRAAGDSFYSSSTKVQSKAAAAADERSFLPLSTTSSVTSVIDKSVVKHYVANDRSIYEKRRYDDIEFEEFEVYDPTKDFEKLIEEEEAKRASAAEEQQSANASNSSSMRTAKSQQTNGSAETETDCYDSLDDKL